MPAECLKLSCFNEFILALKPSIYASVILQCTIC